MDSSNRGEGRRGQPLGNTGNRKANNQAPMSFEGMNYEQKRKPYREESNQEKERNGDDEAETTLRRNG